MIGTLLAIFLAAQGIPTLQGTGGTISGTLKSADGTPAVGVRVAAALRPDSLADFATQGALMSIAQSDENGRFTLENVPQGRYLITAGKVDLPTYYPGTIDITSGRAILITSGAIVSGIDFVLADPSVRSNDPYDFLNGRSVLMNPTRFVTVDIKTEDGAKLPVFANSKYPVVRLTRKSDHTQVEMMFSHSSIEVPVQVTGVSEYGVTVENLPDGYVVKSLRSDIADLKTGPLQLQPTAFQLTGPAAAAFIAGLTAGQNGTPPLAPPLPTATPGRIVVPPLPAAPSAIFVTLAKAPLTTPIPSGARVSGQTTETGVRSIYLSDNSGIFYSDGSFEFRGVAAGRHTILLVDPESSAAGPKGISLVVAGGNVVVGEKDIEAVTLEAINMLPLETDSLVTPRPANGRAPGSIPLATIHGRVVQESSKQALAGGTVSINGRTRTMFRINADGRFEIPRLFPGTYKLEVGNFGYETVRETIEVEDEDITIEFSSAKL